MKAIAIKALDQQYFDEANSNGEVYGIMERYIGTVGQKQLYVFVWLGELVYEGYWEIKGKNTKFKRFFGCTIEVAPTLKLLDEGKVYEQKEVTIELFY